MPPKFYQDGRETALYEHITALDPSTFRNNPTALLAAIDEYVNTRGRMMIFQQPKVDIARQALEKLEPKPKVLVELGGYVDKSAIAWGDMLRAFHGGEAGGVKVISMELEADFVRIIRNFVDLVGLQGVVEVMEGQSGDSLRMLRGEKGIDKIDVLFLDHWEKFYLSDLRICEELGLLRVGSVVVADNTDMPGAPEYLEYVQGGGDGGRKYRCETILVDEPGGYPRAVHFAYVEETP